MRTASRGWETYSSHFGLPSVPYPIVLGYEIAGVIDAIGASAGRPARVSVSAGSAAIVDGVIHAAVGISSIAVICAFPVSTMMVVMLRRWSPLPKRWHWFHMNFRRGGSATAVRWRHYLQRTSRKRGAARRSRGGLRGLVTLACNLRRKWDFAQSPLPGAATRKSWRGSSAPTSILTASSRTCPQS